MTPTEKIEQMILVSPPRATEELRHWVQVQRDAGLTDETICRKMVESFRKVAKELGYI